MTDRFRLDPDGNLRSELLEEFAWLRHGFGTRTADLPALPMATVKQIHSAEIRQTAIAGPCGKADALISATPGLAVGVKTADCVSVLLVDSEHRVVAAVHAGWRGTVQEIVALTVAAMVRDYETNPISIYAAIGPAIGACCYEVSADVARRFVKWDPSLATVGGKPHLDLESFNAMQLQAAGVPVDQIARAGLCTKCNIDTYFSFREEGEKAGRMMSWIALK